MADPLTDPGRVLSAALNGPLASVVASVDGVPAWGWLVADGAISEALAAGAIPGLLIAYPASEFTEDGFIGQPESAGSLIVKAIAATDDAARSLLAAAVAALAAGPLTPPLGTAAHLQWLAEVPIPPGTTSYAAAARYAARVRRA